MRSAHLDDDEIFRVVIETTYKRSDKAQTTYEVAGPYRFVGVARRVATRAGQRRRGWPHVRPDGVEITSAVRVERAVTRWEEVTG